MKRKWNWTRMLLVVSLGLNLVIAGMVIGSVFAHRDGRRPDAFSGGGIRPYVASLPAEQREQVRDRLMHNREAAREARQQVRSSSEDVRAAITAQPFAPEKLDAAFAAQRAVYERIAASGHHALVAILAGMSDEERAAFIARLKSFRR